MNLRAVFTAGTIALGVLGGSALLTPSSRTCATAVSTAYAGEAAEGTYDYATLACVGAPGDCGQDRPLQALKALATETTATIGNLAVHRPSADTLSAASSTFPARTNSRRFRFSNSPGWVSSGTWSRGGRLLILADGLLGKCALLVYDTRGALVKRVGWKDLFTRDTGEPKCPSIIHQLGSGYLVEFEDSLLAQLNQDLRLVRKIDLIRASEQNGRRINGLYRWVPFGEMILAIADVEIAKKESSSWQSGVLLIPLNKPSQFRILKRMDRESTSKDMYRLGHSLLTAIDNKGYFLLGEPSPKLYEAGVFERTIPDFPETFRFPSMPGTPNPVAVFGNIEKSSIPVGIFGRESRLWMLAREPTAKGTQWTMSIISPCGGIQSSKIPDIYGARHVLAIPGSTHWAFVEKDAVTVNGQQLQQKVPTFVLVPTSELKAETAQARATKDHSSKIKPSVLPRDLSV